MIKIAINILIFTLLLALFNQLGFAQKTPNDEKLIKARILMSDYQDAMLFRNMNDGSYDPSWEGIFRSLFRTSRIVFDIPFRVSVSENDVNFSTDTYKSDDNITRNYLEQVSIDTYIETIRAAYGWYNMTDFTYSFAETGFDTLGLAYTHSMRLAYRKTFSNTEWSVRDSRNYIFEIRFFESQPFITSIRLAEEEMARTKVVLTFVNSRLRRGEPGFFLSEMVGQINFEFDETIRNTSLRAKTDSLGVITPGLIPNRATIKIDTVFGLSGERYSIPSDWRTNGYKVSNQPATGFIVPLMPWTWNGFSWSPRAFAGIIMQGKNHLVNFSPDSEFTGKTGYKFGLGLEVAKYFDMNQILSLLGSRYQTDSYIALRKRREMYIGLGSGMYYYEYQYRIGSTHFMQKPYWYVDRLEEPVLILVSGSEYEEIVKSSGLSVPVFLEYRKNTKNLSSLFRAWSLQAGINFIIPFETEFKVSGNFSRHGYYAQYNPQPITNDPFYNYYTDTWKEAEDNIIGNAFLPAWHFRLNGLFNISGARIDNLLDAGILLTFPWKSAGLNDPVNFYVLASNDEFSSLSNSKKEIFRYFIGFSVGYNFIKYRL